MDDCDYYGSKHKLYIAGARDLWLMGDVTFKCRKCSSIVVVDRFWFYQALKTPREVDSGS